MALLAWIYDSLIVTDPGVTDSVLLSYINIHVIDLYVYNKYVVKKMHKILDNSESCVTMCNKR